MTDESSFTAEELAAFRAVDRQYAVAPARMTETPQRVLQPSAPTPQTPTLQPPAMSAAQAQSASWNSWAMQVIEYAWRTHYQDAIAEFTAEFVQKKIDTLAQMLGEETGANERQLKIEINKLAEEVVELKVQLAYLRGARSAEIIDLPALPRKNRNAA
jgi:hypothetical protein